MSKCDNCPYNSAIGAKGCIDAPLVIVGQGPGHDEIPAGIPFVGKSGQLLDRALRYAGLDSTPTYFTNAINCLCDEPDKALIVGCRDRLITEIASNPRKLIIALGGPALHSITDLWKLKISSVRGNVFETAWGPCIATFHPAAILRGVADYRTFMADIMYAREVFTHGKRSPGETLWKTIQDRDLGVATERIRSSPYVACDIETTSLDPKDGRILCVGVSFSHGRTAIFSEDQLPALCEALRDTVCIWHNGKFDAAYLQYRGFEVPVSHDTEMMHLALCETPGTHGLQPLARAYLGADDWKDETREVLGGKLNVSFSALPKEVLHKRLAQDADYTLQLFETLLIELENDPDAMRLYRGLLMPATRFLQRVESRGMLIDREAMDNLSKSLDLDKENAIEIMKNEIKKVTERKIRYSGDKFFTWETFNPNSPDQVGTVIYKVLGLRPILGGSLLRRFKWNTDKKSVSLLPQVPFVLALMSYRSASKIKGTYVVGLMKKLWTDGRLYTSMLLHGTETGRLSSRNPNLHNIPRDKRVKSLFRASPGHVLIEFDYSQAELRTLAHFSKDPNLMQIFIDGKDPHSETARHIYGHDPTDAERQIGKHCNFAIVYGSGPDTMSERFGMPLETARRIMNDLREAYSVAWAFLERCRSYPDHREPLVTPFGRKRRWGLVDNDNIVHLRLEAGNFPIQSVASDLNLISMIRADDQLAEWGARILNLVHDSGIVECPDDPDTIGRVIDYVIGIMEDTPRMFLNARVPFVADAKVGRSWGTVDKYQPTEIG